MDNLASGASDEVLHKARHLFEGGDFNAALEVCEELLSNSPFNPEANYYLAALLNWSGNQHKAIAYLERANLSPGADNDYLDYQSYENFCNNFASDQTKAIENGCGGVLFTALPKSASVFLYVTLSSLMRVPACRVSVGTFPDMTIVPGWLNQFRLGGAITHDHFSPTAHNLDQLRSAGVSQVLVHVRDPRQALLSFIHMETARLAVIQTDATTSRSDIATYLQLSLKEKIEHGIAALYPHVTSWIKAWVAVSDSDQSYGIVWSNYEAFVADKIGHIEQLISKLNQPIRTDLAIADVLRIVEGTAGATNFRKGQGDEWREVFTEVQKEKAWRSLEGPLADRFGWQK